MPRRRQFLATLATGTATAALTTTAAGCLAAPPRANEGAASRVATDLDEWAHAQFRGGLRNRGYVDRSVPGAVSPDWSLPVNRGDHTAAKSTPVTAPDGDLLVAGDTGTVRRVTPDGDVRWTADVEPTRRGIHGTPAVANDTVYVGAYDGALYAFDLASGDRLWRRPLGDAIGSSPVYYDGVVYIAVEYSRLPSGSVAAVAAGSGNQLWADGRPTDQPHSTLAIDRAAGRLVVGANDGNCYAWTFPGLERAWVFETERPIKGPVAVTDGIAVFGSWDGFVYGLALADGREAWRVDTGSEVMSGPAVDPDGTVYVGNHAGLVLAVDGASGDVYWRRDVGGAVIGSLTATRDHVLCGSYDDRLHALDTATGDRTWAFEGAGRATSAPLVTDDAIYYAARRPSEDEAGRCYRLVSA